MSSAHHQKGSFAHDKSDFPAQRKLNFSDDDEEDSRGFQSSLKCLTKPPKSKIYNSSFGNNKPAELFRKDLISAMKMPDSEHLEDYWPLTDSWKQEWERGVQVPVNPHLLPHPVVREIKKKEKYKDFRLPKKYLRCTRDDFFSNDLHILSEVAAAAEKVCRYDLDDTDVQWLRIVNEERYILGLDEIEELTMEQIMEDFESQCFDKIQEEVKAVEGLGIEFDEDVICDVCRSPDSEEGNEMVFCDACNICVHQACYGITSIPEGSWVCRTCALGIRPFCLLCPNKGGAMKSTRSGEKWAHVSCALWIPEVSIGCVEKMEPITKVSQIPASRWSLVCCLCRERQGACIQCSVKTCKIAYHVTCAFKDGLEMKAIIEDGLGEEAVKLKSYCEKHSKKKEGSQSSDADPEPKKRSKKAKPKQELEMSGEERASVRASKVHQIEGKFYKYVDTKETCQNWKVDPIAVDFIYNYWKLKRTANRNRPLLTPKQEETDLVDKLEENSMYARMKMFVHLRQDLERVRNLCYMVSRREKLARSFLHVKEDIFHQQVEVLTDQSLDLSDKEVEAVVQANHSENVYDRLYSADPLGAPSSNAIISVLEGKDVQNLFMHDKKSPSHPARLPNPYAKHYINGLRSHRRLTGGYNDSLDELYKELELGSSVINIDGQKESQHELKQELEDSAKHEVDSIVDDKPCKYNTRKIRRNRSSGSSVTHERHSISASEDDDCHRTPDFEKEVNKERKEHVLHETKKTERNKEVYEKPEEKVMTEEDSANIPFAEVVKNSRVTRNSVKIILEEPADSVRKNKVKEENSFYGAEIQCDKDANKPVSPEPQEDLKNVPSRKTRHSQKLLEAKDKSSHNNNILSDDKVANVFKKESSKKAKSINKTPEQKVKEEEKSETVQISQRATRRSQKLNSSEKSPEFDSEQHKSLEEGSQPEYSTTRTLKSSKELDESREEKMSSVPKTETSAVVKQEKKKVVSDNETQYDSSEKVAKLTVKVKCSPEKSDNSSSESPSRKDRHGENLCQVLMSGSLSPRGSLSGYKIPKKSKTESESTEDKRGSSPISPLHEVPSHKIDHYFSDGYKRSKHKKDWNRHHKDEGENASSELMNGQNHSPRLVIKLTKDPNYPDAQYWKSNTNLTESSSNKQWNSSSNSHTKRSGHYLRSNVQADSSGDLWTSPSGTKENGARYSTRYRTLGNKYNTSDFEGT